MGKSRIDVTHQKLLNVKYQSYVILSGSRKSHTISEATAMCDFIRNHYPDMLQVLLLEELSIDTLQNAFFTKVIHIDPLEIKQFTIITNSLHITRTKQIFTNLFDKSYHFEFLETVDPETDEKTIGLSETYPRIAGQALGVTFNLAQHATPVGIATTAVSIAAGKVGIWAEKLMVKSIASPQQTPEGILWKSP